MNFKQQTGKSIQEAFNKFHKENPKVYKYFKEYFFYLHKRKGWQKVSGKLIIERMRWEVLIKSTVDRKNIDFKIDNNFTAHYVRLFISEHPEYAKCFELRELRSIDMQTNLF